MTKELLEKAIDISSRALTWPEHEDFKKVYIALEKIHSILLAASERPIKW